MMPLPRAFGPYTLLKRLAVGGMAEIYVAKTRGLGGFEKLVALKLVHPHLSADPHFVQMLIDEAKILVLLTHANVAQVFDLGCIDGTYYISMEYVEGLDVHALQKAAARTAQELPIPVCCYIIAEMLNGLDYAHRKRDASGRPLNIVHRDVSPQNVLISHAGEVKLVDFGIAKTALSVEGTEVGVIKGKYYYMSPEQAWADPIDRRSDVFSTGIVLYEMLTGRMLYSARSIPELIGKVRAADIQPPRLLRPEIPEVLERIVMKALARDANARFQSALDMAEALRDYLYEAAPAFNAARLAQYVSSLLEAEKAVRADEPKEADATGQLEALSRDEYVRTENSVLFPLESGRSAVHNSQTQAGKVRVRRTHGPGARTSIPPPPPPRVSTWPLESPEEPPTERWRGSLAPPPVPSLASASALRLPATPGRSSLPPPPPPPDETEPTARYRPRHVQDVLVPEPPTRKGWTRRSQAPGPYSQAPGPYSQPPPPYGGYARPYSQAPAAAAYGYTQGPHYGYTQGPVPYGYTQALMPPPGDVEAVASIPPSPPVPDFGSESLFPKRRSRRRTLQVLAGLGIAACCFFAFRLASGAPRPPQLEVISVPQGAKVRLDGALQEGTTPLRISGLEEGRSYALRVELPGYVPWETTHFASPGAVQHIAVLRPVTGELQIVSTPQGATVYLDDTAIGKTPLTVSSLPLGRRLHLRVRHPGHAEASREVVVTAEKAVERFTLTQPSHPRR